MDKWFTVLLNVITHNLAPCLECVESVDTVHLQEGYSSLSVYILVGTVQIRWRRKRVIHNAILQECSIYY